MSRRILAALGVTFCVGVACSSNSDQHAPALADGGASSRGGAGGRTAGGKSGDGGTADGGGGERDDGGAGGAAGNSAGEGGEGGEGGAEQGTIVPVEPGVCSADAGWANAKPLDGISTDANEQLLAITPDELDIVFLRDNTAMRAHRELASAPFDAGSVMTIPDGYGVDTGVALSADGKTLVLLATGGQSFGAFARTSRSGEFVATPDTAAFMAINQRAIQTMQHYAAPVLAPDGKTFVFAAFTPEPPAGFPAGVEGIAVVYEAAWSGGGWAMPVSISQNLFDGTTATRPLPSGLSSDSRALFYFDEASGKQLARFRDRPDAPLYTVVDIGARTGATPDARCDRLYYSSDGDVLVAE